MLLIQVRVNTLPFWISLCIFRIELKPIPCALCVGQKGELVNAGGKD